MKIALPNIANTNVGVRAPVAREINQIGTECVFFFDNISKIKILLIIFTINKLEII